MPDKLQITGSIPPELGTLTNLDELKLEHNLLTGTIPAELSNMTGEVQKSKTACICHGPKAGCELLLEEVKKALISCAMQTYTHARAIEMTRNTSNTLLCRAQVVALCRQQAAWDGPFRVCQAERPHCPADLRWQSGR